MTLSKPITRADFIENESIRLCMSDPPVPNAGEMAREKADLMEREGRAPWLPKEDK